MAAERIQWSGEVVADQLNSLRLVLTQCLDDTAGSLRQARNILRRQDAPPAISCALDAQVRRLESIQEHARQLWRKVQVAHDILDQAERDITAMATALLKGDAGPSSPSPANPIPPVPPILPLRNAQRPARPQTWTAKPILGIDNMLKGRTVVTGGAWTAPLTFTLPWLAEALAQKLIK